MYKIVIKGTAKTEYPNLNELNGISCEDDFAEYFNGQSSYRSVIKSGYMRFEHNKEENKLYTITEYISNRPLNVKELKDLESYTVGQWSDGIGEGFEQNEVMYAKEPYLSNEYDDCDDLGVFISPWHRDQIVTVNQYDENGNNLNNYSIV
jgi:hypothetical protein